MIIILSALLCLFSIAPVHCDEDLALLQLQQDVSGEHFEEFIKRAKSELREFVVSFGIVAERTCNECVYDPCSFDVMEEESKAYAREVLIAIVMGVITRLDQERQKAEQGDSFIPLEEMTIGGLLGFEQGANSHQEEDGEVEEDSAIGQEDPELRKCDIRIVGEELFETIKRSPALGGWGSLVDQARPGVISVMEQMGELPVDYQDLQEKVQEASKARRPGWIAGYAIDKTFNILGQNPVLQQNVNQVLRLPVSEELKRLRTAAYQCSKTTSVDTVSDCREVEKEYRLAISDVINKETRHIVDGVVKHW